MKIKATNSLLAVFAMYFIYSSWQGIYWKLDPHHDGYVYLPAFLAQSGLLPPQYAKSAYGIAQPVVESLFISTFGDSLITYRSIAFFLILGTALLIYRLIRLKASMTISIAFSIVWISANPLWANSIQEISMSIQTPWPNIWVQMLTLLALLLVIKCKSFCNTKFLLVGSIASTLPFFRIQGLISTAFIVALILFKKQNYKHFFIGAGITSFFWILLIANNGGIMLYLNNIIVDPIEGLNQYTTISYQLNFAKGLFGYYTFIYWLFLTLVLLLEFTTFGKSRNKKWMNLSKSYKITYSSLSLFVLVQYIETPNLWNKTIFNNSSTLVLDLAIPLAIETLALFVIRNKFKINQIRSNFNLTIGLAIFVLVNLINQYPLPDLGHRWWGSAINSIFIFLLFFHRNKNFVKLQNNISIKILIAFTVLISLTNATIFIQNESRIIEIDSPRQFNGMRISSGNENRTLNFVDSMKIIKYLEENKVKIEYKCRDGLYYVRDKDFTNKSAGALVFLPEVKRIVSAKFKSVSLYCNVNNVLLTSSLPRFSLIVGKSEGDIFVFHKSLKRFYLESKELMRDKN